MKTRTLLDHSAAVIPTRSEMRVNRSITPFFEPSFTSKTPKGRVSVFVVGIGRSSGMSLRARLSISARFFHFSAPVSCRPPALALHLPSSPWPSRHVDSAFRSSSPPTLFRYPWRRLQSRHSSSYRLMLSNTTTKRFPLCANAFACSMASLETLSFTRSTVREETHIPTLLNMRIERALVPSILKKRPQRRGSELVARLRTNASMDIETSTAWDHLLRQQVPIHLYGIINVRVVFEVNVSIFPFNFVFIGIQGSRHAFSIAVGRCGEGP